MPASGDDGDDQLDNYGQVSDVRPVIHRFSIVGCVGLNSGKKGGPRAKRKRFSGEIPPPGESGIAGEQTLSINSRMARILFLGDIVGRAGREAVARHLGQIRAEERIDMVIANGENAAGGSGITPVIAGELHAAGVDAITLGDHCWDQRGFEKEIDALPYLSRPFNLLPGSPGADRLVVEGGGMRLGVVTILGQVLVKIGSEAGFPRIMPCLDELRGQCDAVLVEMHAETTSEKLAMGWYLDGRVAAVVGTHTHVPTADARILPRGTGYITDVGMCGPYDSVLGRDIAPVLGRFLDGLPRKFTVAEHNVQLHGAIIEAVPGQRGCTAFERFSFVVPEGD
jgi:metallophosphoesterase (TIGR00282 family)